MRRQRLKTLSFYLFLTVSCYVLYESHYILSTYAGPLTVGSTTGWGRVIADRVVGMNKNRYV